MNDTTVIENLRSALEYRDGKLFWRINTPKRRAGDEAGYTEDTGYSRVQVNGVRYGLHRVIFAMHYGYWPQCIDHINGNTTDNRIENLRDVTVSQNGMNRCPKKAKTQTGILGVSYEASRNRYIAHIKINGKYKNLGRFETAEEAAQVRKDAELKYFGEYRRDARQAPTIRT